MFVQLILKYVHIGGLNDFIWQTIPFLNHPDWKSKGVPGGLSSIHYCAVCKSAGIGAICNN